MSKKPYKPNFTALDNLVKEGFLRKVVSDCGRLVLYNYTDKCTYKRRWTKHTLNSRGSVYEIDSGCIIARAFPKFFNFEELPVTRQRGLNKLKDFEVFEKKDGSLAIIYNYDNKWRVNTRGSFNSDQAIRAQDILTKYDLSDIPKDHTILAEIIYPENKIIVDYGDEEKLVILAVYHNGSGYELSWKELQEYSKITGMDLPRKYTFKSIDDLVEIQNVLSAHEEGFVVRLADGDRIKFKSKEYLKLSRLMSNITPLNFWHHMEQGEVPEQILEQIPEEFRETADTIKANLEREYLQLKFEVIAEVEYILEKTKGSENQRREIGIIMKQDKEFKHLSCAFSVLDDSPDFIDKYVMKAIRPKGNEIKSQ